ncbi:hypothetical protein JW796_02200 [Candidatus Dojkabacteria bacterium]|nr:hypothetical protein [Candidatus Dojkabacteria bacterium]
MTDASPEISGKRKKSGYEPGLSLGTCLRKSISKIIVSKNRNEKQLLANQLVPYGTRIFPLSIHMWDLGLDDAKLETLKILADNYEPYNYGIEEQEGGHINYSLNVIVGIALVNIGARTEDLQLKEQIVEKILDFSQNDPGFSTAGLKIMLLGLSTIADSVHKEKREAFAYGILDKLIEATGNEDNICTKDQRDAAHFFVRNCYTTRIRELFIQQIATRVPTFTGEDNYIRLLEIAVNDQKEENTNLRLTHMAINSFIQLIDNIPGSTRNIVECLTYLCEFHPNDKVRKHAQKALRLISEQ